MKRFFKTNFAAAAGRNSMSVQFLMNELLSDLQGNIALNKIVVENEVAAKLKLHASQSEVVLVIRELLNTVVANARDTSLLITAEKFSEIMTLRIVDGNNYNGYALSFSLMSVVRQARCMGGDIVIRGAQGRVATISFSFPDLPYVKEYSYGAIA